MKGVEEMEEGRVILTLEQYSELVSFKTKYIVLVNAMLQGADIGWRENSLAIDVDAATATLRACEPSAYETALNRLRAMKKERVNENDSE